MTETRLYGTSVKLFGRFARAYYICYDDILELKTSFSVVACRVRCRAGRGDDMRVCGLPTVVYLSLFFLSSPVGGVVQPKYNLYSQTTLDPYIIQATVPFYWRIVELVRFDQPQQK